MTVRLQNGSRNQTRARCWMRLLTAGLFAVVLASSGTVGATGDAQQGSVTGMVQAVVNGGAAVVQDLQQFFELIRLREASSMAAVAPAPISRNPLLKFCSAPAESDPSVIPATKKSRS